MSITPNRPKALQYYLQNTATELHVNGGLNVDRIGFLKVEKWDGPAIVYNEWDWSVEDLANISYEKGIDIFPILIDVVVKYEDYKDGYAVRWIIRKLLGKFNGSLSPDWEGTIVFKQYLAPVYNKDTDDIVFGAIYLLKQNYDYANNTD